MRAAARSASLQKALQIGFCGARAGKKIASVVRIATVFAASSIPILMATLGPHQDDPTLPVGCAARHSAPRPSSGRMS